MAYAKLNSKYLPDFETYFDNEALIKAFYIPSKSLQLSEQEKQVALSPQRIPERESGTPQPITPETQAYLLQTNNVFDTNKRLQNHETPSNDSTSKFEESWPSTEKSSSLPYSYISAKEDNSPDEVEASKSNYQDENSVISKYLKRFHCDPPTKREHRKPVSSRDFWWNKAPTQLYEEKVDLHTSENYSTKATNNSTGSSISPSNGAEMTPSNIGTPKSSLSSFQNKERKHIDFTQSVCLSTPNTRKLVEKTDELLDKSLASISISSSGLEESSSPSLPSKSSNKILHSTPEDNQSSHTGNKDMSRYMTKYTKHDLTHHEKQAQSDRKVRPEDDILYLWRLKRRYELAQDKVYQAEYQAKLSSMTSTQQQPFSKTGKRLQFNEVQHKKSNTDTLLKTPFSTNNRQQVDTQIQKTLSSTKPVQTDPELDNATTQTVHATQTTLATQTILASHVAQSTQTTPTVDPLGPRADSCKGNSTKSLHCNRCVHARCRCNIYSTTAAEPTEVVATEYVVDEKDSCVTIENPNAQTTPVSKAVQQVVGQRLFGTSQADEYANTINSDNKSQPGSDHSDAEYPDDHVLKSLREKRNLLNMKLRAIDIKLKVAI